MNDELFTVRACEIRDAQSIELLERQAVDEGQQYRGVQQILGEAPLIGADLSNVLSSGNQFVLIVDHQSQTQGFAHVVIDGEVATVRRIFIATQARNLGAGAKLLAAVRTEAKRRGCKQIDAIALPGDRLTKNLFERANMKARLLIASSDL